ncbi:unnamed protein product [Heligmosomoides polygyrus]|uniref:MSP domain-containing protein n=1 Tax=Heligmosomoides polygyrus TaxID=6339 RepID=A0A183FUC6_HELPZ|nr:unnamed protein product [Heligmosomoides polygyrus]
MFDTASKPAKSSSSFEAAQGLFIASDESEEATRAKHTARLTIARQERLIDNRANSIQVEWAFQAPPGLRIKVKSANPPFFMSLEYI